MSNLKRLNVVSFACLIGTLLWLATGFATGDEVRQGVQVVGREPPLAGAKEDIADVFQPVAPPKVKVESTLLEMEIPATYTSTAVRMDGKLDDPVWQTAKEVSGFRLRGKKDAPPVKAQTFVRVLYDDKNIYFGVRFLEPEMGKLVSKFNQRDLDIYNDDCFELVFDTRNSPKTFYHFCANLIGGIYDSCNGDKNWSSYNSVCQGTLGDKEWTLELSVPFVDLSIPRPLVGDEWGIRFCRERKPVAENTSIPFTQAAFFARQDMAKLVFKGASGTTTALHVEAGTEIQWGMNRIPVHLQNTSLDAVEVRLTGTVMGAGNVVLGVYETPVSVPAQGKATVELRVPVTTDAMDRLSLVVYDAKGTPVWGKALTPAFAPSAPALAKIEAMLPSLKSDALQIGVSKHPIARGVVLSAEKLAAAVQSFRSKVDHAIAKAELLPVGDWESMREILAGFDKWQRMRQFLFWEADPWANGTPFDFTPTNVTAEPRLVFKQAGNERECRAVQLHGLMVGGRLDVRLVPSHLMRKGDPKSYITPNRIHIYHAPYLRDGFNRLITDPLVESSDHLVSLSPGRTEKVWVVFDSKGLEPGEYEGKITIKPLDVSVSERSAWRTIPIQVTVWDFALPETKDWPLDTFLFYGSITPMDETAMLHLLHDYHINWSMTNRYRYDWGMTEDGLSIDSTKRPKGVEHNQFFRPELISSQDIFLREAKRLGMKVMFAWNCSRSLEWFKLFVAHMKELGFGYDEYALQGISDEFYADMIEKHMPFHRDVYAMDPNIQFMATLTAVPPPAGATFEQLEEAAKYIKIWIPHLPRVWPPETKCSKENIEWFRARDRKIWPYTCETQMQNWACLDYYRFSPWRAFISDVDGIVFWTLMSAKGDDGFDHGDGYDEGMALRGLGNAPVPTKRLEALREGLEDYAYASILKKLIAQAKAQGNETDLAAYEKLIARDTLEELITLKDQQKVDKWRLDVADAILKLKK